MSRLAALSLNGIALGIALCGLLVPGLQYALHRMIPAVEFAEEAAFVAGICGAIAIVLALILRINNSHRYLPIAGYMNLGALFLSIFAISIGAFVFATREPDQPRQMTKAAAPESAAEQLDNPVHRGKKPNELLVHDYLIELDTQLLNDLNLTVADVEAVLKREYDPRRRQSETDKLLERKVSLDLRILHRLIIRIQEGQPLYLEDVAIVRDPQGKPLK